MIATHINELDFTKDLMNQINWFMFAQDLWFVTSAMILFWFSYFMKACWIVKLCFGFVLSIFKKIHIVVCLVLLQHYLVCSIEPREIGGEFILIFLVFLKVLVLLQHSFRLFPWVQEAWRFVSQKFVFISFMLLIYWSQ